MILLIDNYDSFTYNLYQYVGELYSDIRVVRNDCITIGEINKLSPEGIILSPGPGTPKDAGICPEAVKAFAGKIPILGICLGHQTIGYAFGGNIVRAKCIKHGKSSTIKHTNDALFKDTAEEFRVMRYHSLVIDQDTFPKELSATSISTDDNEIMSLKHKDYEVYGVQFHPESIFTDYGHQIIKNFVEVVKNASGSN